MKYTGVCSWLGVRVDEREWGEAVSCAAGRVGRSAPVTVGSRRDSPRLLESTSNESNSKCTASVMQDTSRYLTGPAQVLDSSESHG